MVSVFPVDLEYLQFVDLDDSNQQRLVDATIDAQLELLTEQNLTDRKNTLVVGTILWETSNSLESPIKKNFQYFQKKCQARGVQNHFLVGLEKKSILSDIDNVTYIDFFLLRSYYEGICKNQILNKKWHPENKKFLFLMGKSFKPHRVGLLYRLHEQDILNDNRAIWSFYDQLTVDECKKYAPESASLQDIDTFINHYRRLPDQVSPINGHYGGFPFDPLLYTNTNLSIVSETQADSIPWNTEKIYKTILNHHPFVIAGAVNHNEHLNNMGFETFDQYFAVPDYSSIADLNSRLDAIVENVKQFDPSAEQIKQIHHATQKNFLRLHELSKHHIDIIDQMLARYGISRHWTEILPLQDSEFLTWQYYYQKIKDPSWPPCASVADCANLPEKIQEELRTQFNVNF